MSSFFLVFGPADFSSKNIPTTGQTPDYFTRDFVGLLERLCSLDSTEAKGPDRSKYTPENNLKRMG